MLAKILLTLLILLGSFSVSNAEQVFLPKYRSWGKATDTSHSGTMTVGSPTFTSTGHLLGSAALQVNGTSQYVQAGYFPEFDRTKGFSLSMWVKFDAGGIDRQALNYPASKYGNTKGWALGVHGTYTGSSCAPAGENVSFLYSFNSSGTGQWVCGPSGVLLTDGAWYLLTVTVSSTGSTTVYTNATAGTPSTIEFKNSPLPHLEFGRRSDGNWYFKGLIDDVRYYSRELTSAEVTAIYNAGTGVACDGDEHHCWNFDTAHKTKYHTFYKETATFNNTYVRPLRNRDSLLDWYQYTDRGNVVSLAPSSNLEGLWYVGGRPDLLDYNQLPDFGGKNRFLILGGSYAGGSGSYLSTPHGAVFPLQGGNYWYSPTGEYGAVSSTTAFSVFAKFETPNTVTGYSRTIVEGYNGTNDSIWLYMDTTGKLTFRIRGASGTEEIKTAGALSANTWYTIVARYDGTQLKLKVNATAATPVSTTNTSFTSFSDFRIAAGSAANTRWAMGGGTIESAGNIAEVGAYSIVLTDAEVDWLINNNDGRRKPLIFASTGTYTTPNIQLPNPGSVTKVKWAEDENTGTAIEYTNGQGDARIKCASTEGGLAGASWNTVTNGGNPSASCGATTQWVKLEYTFSSTNRFRSPYLYGVELTTDVATPCAAGFKTRQLFLDNNEEIATSGLVTFKPAALNITPSLSNWNDLRIFRKKDGTAAELDRTVSGDEIHFKTQASIDAYAQDASYYLCYGYSSAGAPPANEANVYSSVDNFTDLTAWTKTEQGGSTATATGGEVVVNLAAAPSITNASFEDALGAEWTCSGCSTFDRATTPVTDGTYSLRWLNNGSGGMAQQVITVTANTQYIVTADIFNHTDMGSSAIYVSTASYNTGAALCSATNAGYQSWATLNCTIPSSNTATTLYLILKNNNSQAGEYSYADKILLGSSVRLSRTTANTGIEKREVFDICTPASATGLRIRAGFTYSATGAYASRSTFGPGLSTVDMTAQVDAVTPGASRTKYPVGSFSPSTCYTVDYQIAKNAQMLKVFDRVSKTLVWSGVADLSNQAFPEETSLHPSIEIYSESGSGAINGTTIDNWRLGHISMPGIQVEPFEWTFCAVDGGVEANELMEIDASGNEVWYKRWGRLFKSLDGCQTSTQVFDFETVFGEQEIVGILKPPSGSLIIATNIDGTLYRCPSGADCTQQANWTKVYSNGLTSVAYRRAWAHGFGLDFDTDGRLFAAQYGCSKGSDASCDTNWDKMFVLRSSDDGATWEKIYRLHAKNLHFHMVKVDRGATPNRVYISAHHNDTNQDGRLLAAASNCTVTAGYGCYFADYNGTSATGYTTGGEAGCTNTTTTFDTDITGYADNYWTGGIVRFETGANQWQDKDVASYNGTTGCVTIDPVAGFDTALPNVPVNGEKINLAKVLDRQDSFSATTLNASGADRRFISLLDDQTNNKVVRYNNAAAPFVELYSFGVASTYDTDWGTTVVHNGLSGKTIIPWQIGNASFLECVNRTGSSTPYQKISWLGFSYTNGDSIDQIYQWPMITCNAKFIEVSTNTHMTGVTTPVYMTSQGKYGIPVAVRVRYSTTMKLVPIYRQITGG